MPDKAWQIKGLDDAFAAGYAPEDLVSMAMPADVYFGNFGLSRPQYPVVDKTKTLGESMINATSSIMPTSIYAPYFELKVAAYGEVRPDRLETLRGITPNPDEPLHAVLPAFDLPTATEEIMYLANAGRSVHVFELRVASIDATLYSGGALGVSVGEEALSKDQLTKVEKRIRGLCDSLFAPGYIIDPQRCSLGLHFESPDSLTDIASDVITRARSRYLVDAENFIYGSKGGGLEVWLSEDIPSSFDAESDTKERHITTKSVMFTFYRARIRELAPVIQQHNGDLRGLMEGLLGFAIGSDAFCDPFIRIATTGSRGRPNYHRPANLLWEEVKASFFEPLLDSDEKRGNVVSATARNLKDLLLGARR